MTRIEHLCAHGITRSGSPIAVKALR